MSCIFDLYFYNRNSKSVVRRNGLYREWIMILFADWRAKAPVQLVIFSGILFTIKYSNSETPSEPNVCVAALYRQTTLFSGNCNAALSLTFWINTQKLCCSRQGEKLQLSQFRGAMLVLKVDSYLDHRQGSQFFCNLH